MRHLDDYTDPAIGAGCHEFPLGSRTAWSGGHARVGPGSRESREGVAFA